MSKTVEERMMESAMSLGVACTEVGGNVPDLTMTLREFIRCYGANGVMFGRASDVPVFSESPIPSKDSFEDSLGITGGTFTPEEFTAQDLVGEL